MKSMTRDQKQGLTRLLCYVPVLAFSLWFNFWKKGGIVDAICLFCITSHVAYSIFLLCFKEDYSFMHGPKPIKRTNTHAVDDS